MKLAYLFFVHHTTLVPVKEKKKGKKKKRLMNIMANIEYNTDNE